MKSFFVLLALTVFFTTPFTPVYAYQYFVDDGTAENGVGLTNGGTFTWMNQFDSVAGAETIQSIEVAWGLVPNGTSATAMIWDDPDGDGDPSDRVLLTSLGVTVQNSDTDTFNLIDIVDQLVKGSFFVGFEITHLSGYFPARIDTTSSLGRSWVGSESAGLQFDLIDNYGLSGNWMIRANASAAPVPEPSTFILLGAGLAGLAVWRKKRS